MNSKPWYKSKTVWFNIATVGGAVAGGAVGLLPTLQPLLSVEVYAIAMAVVGLINVGLRSVTKDAVWLVDSNKE
jgi:hypothetical protein